MSELVAVRGVAHDATPQELLTFRFYGCEHPATETLLLLGPLEKKLFVLLPR